MTASTCRACNKTSRYCSPDDGWCMYCFRGVVDWAQDTLGLNVRRGTLPVLDLRRPDVQVAIDQWLEKGRP